MTAGELGIILPRAKKEALWATIGQAATGLTQMSALELAQTIRSKRVSSQDLIEAHFQRIEAVNPQSTLSPSSSARCKEQSKLTKP